MPAEPWRELQRVLVVRADNIGDVVMLGPALRALRVTAPAARFTLLASPAGSQAAPLLSPWLDDVLTRRVLWQDVHGALPHDPARELELVEEVTRRSFDAAFFFTSFSQSPHPPAYVCYLAGVPIRVGQAKEHGGALLTHSVRPPPIELHQAERNAHLLEGVGIRVPDGALELAVPPDAAASAPGLLARLGLDPAARFTLLLPGASADARRYEPARFGVVARELAARSQVPVVVAGSERERELVRTVLAEAGPGVFPLVGETSVSELAALTQRAALVLANNSLGLHLADAFRRPLVVLYSGTDLEEQWRPRSSPARLLRRDTWCTPCYEFTSPHGKQCLDVPPEEVVETALELLTQEPSFAELVG